MKVINMLLLNSLYVIVYAIIYILKQLLALYFSSPVWFSVGFATSLCSIKFFIYPELTFIKFFVQIIDTFINYAYIKYSLVGTLCQQLWRITSVMRGIWGSILLSPANLAYYFKIFIHYFLVIAPAVSVLILIHTNLVVIQIGFFFTGLISQNPADRLFTTFLQKYRFWLFG